ncbi:MAG TPA: hypothetical protein VFS00_00370, partial [Polyangiaceae bacterium]|nr:hypothetical protein [Polyangiaceae bacterium]
MKSNRSGSALNVLVLSFAVAVSYATSECASMSSSGLRVPAFLTGAVGGGDAGDGAEVGDAADAADAADA